MFRAFLSAMLLSLLIAGCQPAAKKATSPEATSPEATTLANLNGTAWKLVSLNGKPPVAQKPQAGEAASAGIEFWDDHINGNSGCNSFGALYLADTNTLHFAPPLATEMGCQGPVREQEDALFRLLSGTVVSSFDEIPQLVIKKGSDVMILARQQNCVSCKRQNPPRGQSLIGKTWQIRLLNDAVPIAFGKYPGYNLFFLRFENSEWHMQIGCNEFGGAYQAQGNRIIAQSGTTTLKECRPDLTAQDQMAQDIMLGKPQYVIGQNGEMLIASAAGMLLLQGPPNPK